MDQATAALEAVSDLRELLRLDGADLHVASADGRTATFELDLVDAGCADCVLPADRLEVLLLAHLEAHIGTYEAVRILDPRANEREAVTATTAAAQMVIRMPDVEFRRRATGYARRLETLAGARIGFLDAWGDQEGAGGMYPTLAALKDSLVADHDVGTVVWEMKPSTSHEVPDAVLRAFVSKVDAVVNGEGICGSCTAATVLDGVLLEAMGVPTITLVQEQFAPAARMHARAGGLPKLPLLIEPKPSDGSSVQRTAVDFIDQHVGEVVRALTVEVDHSEITWTLGR